ncbi:syncytin-1 isoform X1 [Alligator mississippiensis]|uniref:syncytin-1 isoform X1 n=1 Tax=Alligator mississippiensis TaxID=8496 RepID=UPI002877B7A9|nr:syncytin-1 isoform X1 [Alligator mississippiensis]
MYLQYVERAAKAENQSDCWVCSHFPLHTQGGIPMTPIPLGPTKSLLNPSNNQAWDQSQQEFLLIKPVVGDWCFYINCSVSDYINLGTSICHHYFTSSSGGDWRNNNTATPTYCSSYNDFYSSKNLTKGTNPICTPISSLNNTLWYCLYTDTSRGQCFFHGTANPSFKPKGERGVLGLGNGGRIPPKYSNLAALKGQYWVCGSHAYHKIPAKGKGICYPAMLKPSTSFATHLPWGRWRNKRYLQESRDIVDKYQKTPLAKGVLVGCSLADILPGVGTACLERFTLRLQAVIKIMAHKFSEGHKELSKAVAALADTQEELQQMIIQNRIALDFLLAAQGGACAVIGPECCVWVNSSFTIIQTHLNDAAIHIQKAEDIAKIPKDTSLSWLTNWLPSLTGWLRPFILSLIKIVITIICLLCCFQCLCSLGQQFIQRQVKMYGQFIQISSINHQNLTPQEVKYLKVCSKISSGKLEQSGGCSAQVCYYPKIE